ncbi:MAG: aromatic amino acid transport family protein, partial [Patescibacteria group bacterium]|nr:aromatic amino acid transport family protein [Patescibacteria group bacterium]
SIAGASAVPELKEILDKNKKGIKKAIILGTVLPIIFYFVFSLGIVGASGAKTSPEGIMGMKGIFSQTIVDLAAILGILCVATSYLVMGITLKKIFIYDLKITKAVSLLLVCLIPIALFLLGMQNFIWILSFLGLWLGAGEGILLLTMHRRAKAAGDRKPEYSLNLPTYVYYLIGSLFIIAPILTIIFVQYK